MQLKIKRFISVISEIIDPLLGEGGWLPSFVQGEFRMSMQFRNCSYKLSIYVYEIVFLRNSYKSEDGIPYCIL